MADAPFQIPGLGQAKSNEQLPAENFAPDLLTAAASLSGDETKENGPNGAPQEENGEQGKQQNDEQNKAAATQSSTVAETGDVRMEVDADRSSATLDNAPDDVDMKTGDDAPSPDVTHALEAALDGMLSNIGGSDPGPSHVAQPHNGHHTVQQDPAPDAPQEGEPQGAGEAEWEADSSPYESSSESSSSDSDSDDDSEDGGSYPLLGIEETARLLMAADGDGDGDGDGPGKSKGAGAALRTKNEMAEEVIPKPDVTITPEMKIESLGNIEFVVETTVVIKSQTPGEVQVLDSGSVLCKEDRTVIGALAEVLGNVRSPMYTVGFSTEDDIQQLGLVVGMPIFYSVQHANYVFTQPLKEVKGTDASNLHDEELPADEMEFSDDEKEAEYKRALKQKRRGGKAGRGGREASVASTYTASSYTATGSVLNYDEDEDGPYKPLTRPAGFGQGGASSLPALPPKPEAGFGSPPRGGRGQSHRGSHRGGRGEFRGGRNQRGGGGGHRGGGGDRRHGSRGGSPYQQFGRDGAASPQAPFSNAPLPPPFGGQIPPPTGQWPIPPPPPNFVPSPVGYSPPAVQGQQPPAPVGAFNFNYPAWNQNQSQPPPQQQYNQYPHHNSSPYPPPSHQAAHPTWPPVAGAGAGAGGAAPQALPVAYNAPVSAPAPPAYFGGYQQPGQEAQHGQQGQPYWPPRNQ
ncbi:Gar1/Naf1 RNA binding region-domain-containing protein [Dichotomopilus funicola]|uniref:H/ACA ribonucleoprotein complex non-core subunit NAF1 n=1 Tax=Dichotomopilus funicola TaxID=1934379 RepID=A0AAN6V4H9_9PEZI|nr:Gar1/Naf1 RNA binding region-domain-containing protein [Dichotomopilus funicola]